MALEWLFRSTALTYLQQSGLSTRGPRMRPREALGSFPGMASSR